MRAVPVTPALAFHVASDGKRRMWYLAVGGGDGSEKRGELVQLLHCWVSGTESVVVHGTVGGGRRHLSTRVEGWSSWGLGLGAHRHLV